MDTKEISAIIHDIFESFGTDIILDHSRFNAILMDYLPNHPKERKLISSVIAEGIGKDLFVAGASPATEHQFVVQRCINYLMKDAWFSKSASLFAVSCIAEALNLDFSLNNVQDEQAEAIPVRVLSKDFAQSMNDIEFHLPSFSAIGYKAFSGNTKLERLIIPQNITQIKSKAFYNCINLKSIEFHSTISSIGSEVFSGCDSLQEISIPNNPKYVVKAGQLIDKADKRLLRVIPTPNVETVIVPSDIKMIDSRAFESDSITTIRLSSNIERIAKKAFYRCCHLSSIEIVKNRLYQSIMGVMYSADGKSLLFYPSGRKDKSYIVEDSVLVIAESAFENADSLETITIPLGVKIIENNAFRYCTGLNRITLPSSVERIGERAFQGCSSLVGAMLPKSVNVIGDFAFAECVHLESISLPRSVTKIGNASFSKCTSLQSVTIQDNVREVGLNAFDNCGNGLVIRIRNNSYMENYCKAHRVQFEKI